jgi:hypothetical protein
MIVHLQGRGLYKLTMDTETKPTSAIEKSKYLNRIDEAFGTICSLIFLKSYLTYRSVKPPMNPRPPWKEFLENRTR